MSSFTESESRTIRESYKLTVMTNGEAGQDFPLPTDGEWILGRSKTVSLPLEDEKASRRHARIYFVRGQPHLEDLNSANGTFLNGKRIQSGALKDGDIIGIGKARIRLTGSVEVSVEAKDWWEQTQSKTPEKPSGKGTRVQLIQGSLESVSISDLLQLLGNSMKSGVLNVKCEADQGRIFIQDGRVVFAEINGSTSRPPEKTAYRFIRWKSGEFALGKPETRTFETEIGESTQSLLLEGVRIADELGEIESEIPSYHAKLGLKLPMARPLRDMSAEQLDLIQLVLEHQTMLAVLDRFGGDDITACKTLVELRRQGILTVTP